MTIRSINPATGEELQQFESASDREIDQALELASTAFARWRREPLATRCDLLRRTADEIDAQRDRLARTITLEMGKPIAEASAEIEKCALACRYYADNAQQMLAPRPKPSNATQSYIQFVPLGAVLAIMPWNFPFWQVIRCAAPALVAGNTLLLKHASNVPQCALACAATMRAAGIPNGVFQTLLLESERVLPLIEHPAVAGVSVTGSERAGAQIAAAAGRAIKKSVLELGGSDPFIVLADADIEQAALVAVRARFQNAGQSCIAAKRFIVVEEVFDRFRDDFVAGVAGLRVGDPLERSTQLGPLARDDLRGTLERQIDASVAAGAEVLIGGHRIDGPGYFFEPTVVGNVIESMPIWSEETFGPAAALMRADDVDDAVRIANASSFGLGASLWTADLELGRRVAGDIAAGQVFVNGMVASDPRLPFGGVKRSGYGRELGEIGMLEFVNTQTVWIGPRREG